MNIPAPSMSLCVEHCVHAFLGVSHYHDHKAQTRALAGTDSLQESISERKTRGRKVNL